jgi:cytochrome P450
MDHVTTPNSKPIPKIRTWFWRPFKRISDDIERGFRLYGDIIQLEGFWLRVYCLRNPEHIEQVFRHPKVGITKIPRVYPRMTSMMPHSVVVQRGGDRWAEGRRRIRQIFEKDYMHKYAEVSSELVQQMIVSRWEKFADEGTSFDVYEEFQILLTHLAFRILFSKEFSDAKIVEIQRKCFFLESHFSDRLPPILPTPNDFRYRRYMRDLRQIMSDIVHERRESKAKPQDLLNVLLEAHSPMDGSVSDDWVIDQMIEIYKSVRLVNPPLGLGIRLIVQHTDVQRQLIRELADVCESRPLKADDFVRLEYLQMTISEILRFYPSTLGLPRWCEDGIVIDGFQIPPKSIVFSMIYHTHRNPNVFPSPDKFNPDRWDLRDGTRHHPCASLAFGAGKRICVGYGLAMMIMRFILGGIFQRFELISSSDEVDDATNVKLSVHPPTPTLMRVVRHGFYSVTPVRSTSSDQKARQLAREAAVGSVSLPGIDAVHGI